MMSTTFAMNTVTATTFGHKVDIPSAPIAKLMYYLDCVNAVYKLMILLIANQLIIKIF